MNLSKRAIGAISVMGFVPSEKTAIAASIKSAPAQWLRHPNVGRKTIAEVAIYVGVTREETRNIVGPKDWAELEASPLES